MMVPTVMIRGQAIARFKPVIDYIEEQLDGDIAISQLASLAGLSVAAFAHAFKGEYGIAPYRYLLERRIARAKILLRSTSETIASIATQLGFPSHSRFSQVFFRYVGLSPSQYRRSSKTALKRA